MTLALLLAGAILGGFVNGLTGFGFALMASGFWLQVLPPTQAVPLIVVCMLVSNLQALPKVWRLIEMRRTLPLAVGGVLGAPLGVWLLPHVPGDLFKLAVAALIGINSVFTILLRGRLTLAPEKERLAPVAGFIGGVFGGLNGLSGVITTIWSGLFGWTKQEKRGVFQGYNLIMALASLSLFWITGLLTSDLLNLMAMVVPVAIVSAFCGVLVFERMGDKQFTVLINGLLILSALNLLVSVFLN